MNAVYEPRSGADVVDRSFNLLFIEVGQLWARKHASEYADTKIYTTRLDAIDAYATAFNVDAYDLRRCPSRSSR